MEIDQEQEFDPVSNDYFLDKIEAFGFGNEFKIWVQYRYPKFCEKQWSYN